MVNEPRPIGRKKVSAATKRKQKSLEEQAKDTEYEALKEEILKKEAENLKKIFVIRTADKRWWKLFDNSGALYAFLLAPQVGKNHVKFLEDTDPRVKAKYGVTTLKSIEDFEANMVRLKVKKIYDKPGLRVYEMTKAVSQKEMEELLATEAEQRAKANKLIMPELFLPDLFVEVMELSKTTINMVQSINASIREPYGKCLLENAQEIARGFVNTANGWRGAEDYFEETLYRLKDMQADMMPLSYGKIISTNRTFQMMSQIEKTRQQLIKDAKKYKKNAAKQA